MVITKEFTFDAAHKLFVQNWTEEKNREVFGKCYNLHGHSYRLIVAVRGVVPESGMIINFNELSRIVKKLIISRYDHAFLNNLPEFKDKPSTSENIAFAIFGLLFKELEQIGILLDAVTIHETPTSSACITRGEYVALKDNAHD